MNSPVLGKNPIFALASSTREKDPGYLNVFVMRVNDLRTSKRDLIKGMHGLEDVIGKEDANAVRSYLNKNSHHMSNEELLWNIFVAFRGDPEYKYNVPMRGGDAYAFWAPSNLVYGGINSEEEFDEDLGKVEALNLQKKAASQTKELIRKAREDAPYHSHLRSLREDLHRSRIRSRSRHRSPRFRSKSSKRKSTRRRPKSQRRRSKSRSKSKTRKSRKSRR